MGKEENKSKSDKELWSLLGEIVELSLWRKDKIKSLEKANAVLQEKLSIKQASKKGK